MSTPNNQAPPPEGAALLTPEEAKRAADKIKLAQQKKTEGIVAQQGNLSIRVNEKQEPPRDQQGNIIDEEGNPNVSRGTIGFVRGQGSQQDPGENPITVEELQRRQAIANEQEQRKIRIRNEQQKKLRIEMQGQKYSPPDDLKDVAALAPTEDNYEQKEPIVQEDKGESLIKTTEELMDSLKANDTQQKLNDKHEGTVQGDGTNPQQ